LYLGQLRGTLTPEESQHHAKQLAELPVKMEHLLNDADAIEDLSKEFFRSTDFLYLGRGINFPIALEGALKLKEISYIHAEGYAAGELKHGPIALIDEGVPVIVVAPRDDLYDKTVSNMEEVAARGGKIVLLSDAAANGEKTFRCIRVPQAHGFISPLLYALPVQLLAYHAAVFIGTDVDQPRNLAKSVTVE